MKLFDVYPLYEISPQRAQNVLVYDEKGLPYLDLYGGHAVISIGHSHPKYVQAIQEQISKVGFYSNAVQNPLQIELAAKLGQLSKCDDYQLFLCNSGAEANENALKMASFHTGKSKVIAFKNSFHGRTSAAVSATDNPKIQAPLNQQHEVRFLEMGDLESLEKELQNGDVAALIIECIQGVGGLDEASTEFYQKTAQLCQIHQVVLIADEVQSGYGRTGDFFAFQKHGLQPDIISIAKGMGNGFPIGGILLAPKFEAKAGLLGTTFGGSHLACAAGIAVLDVLNEENLMAQAQKMGEYIKSQLSSIPKLKKLKGRGLMLGLEFDFPVAELRKKLLYEHHIFTGGSANPNLLRLLPPLSITEEDLVPFFAALNKELA